MKLLLSLVLLGSLALAQDCGPPLGATNIARYGVATQISVDEGLEGYPENAIDGCKNTFLSKGSCTHNKEAHSPWWRLDLKEQHKIYKVVLIYRMDCCHDRLRGAQIRIGNDPNNNNPVCGTVDHVGPPELFFDCKGMEGRYISVVIPGRTEFLSLCEVEVYGEMLPKKKSCW